MKNIKKLSLIAVLVSQIAPVAVAQAETSSVKRKAKAVACYTVAALSGAASVGSILVTIKLANECQWNDPDPRGLMAMGTGAFSVPAGLLAVTYYGLGRKNSKPTNAELAEKHRNLAERHAKLAQENAELARESKSLSNV